MKKGESHFCILTTRGEWEDKPPFPSVDCTVVVHVAANNRAFFCGSSVLTQLGNECASRMWVSFGWRVTRTKFWIAFLIQVVVLGKQESDSTPKVPHSEWIRIQLSPRELAEHPVRTVYLSGTGKVEGTVRLGLM